MYTPTGCKTLAESTVIPQIRLLIQGYPGVGKTYAALTFPNPVVFNLDRGLGAHFGRSDVIEVPFYDDNFVRKWSGLTSYHPSGLKDQIINWLEKEANQLSPEQTLVFDGSTSLQNAYHRWYKTNATKFLTDDGKINKFTEWDIKKKYFGEIMELFKTLRCHVVYLCHEVDQRDKVSPGMPVSYSGKIRPLLSGGFSDELNGHFTDVFRAMSDTIPTTDPKDEDTKRMWGMSLVEFKAWTKTFPRGTMYYWNTESDSIFDAKNGSLVPEHPKYIPAHYNSFAKYRRKVS